MKIMTWIKRARLGAGSYLLFMSFLMLIWSGLTLFLCQHYALTGNMTLKQLVTSLSLMGSCVGLLFYPLSARRLRDLNFPGWSVHVLAFPLFAVIFLPVLCFLSGPRWDNDYGEPPPASGFVKRLVALIAFFLAMLQTREALIVFYQTRYALSN